MNKRRSSILIVDDERSIRTTLAAILEQEGYDVETAENGAQAIEKSNDKFFDLALVDMRLPDMVGTDLLGRMKERTPKMAKIMVTGVPSMQNAISAVNEGADAYIVKPVDAEILLETIRKHLQKREEEVEYGEQKMIHFIQTRSKELTTETRKNQPAP
ncbi:MAG: response regulator [Thaumarchaeota archaeon]|nr:response regulator [Nitrososphaerota archaeon]